MSTPRRWNVVLHQHEDASFTARVWVDGTLLLPDCVACGTQAALEYVIEALVDVRPGDAIEVRTQGVTGVQSCRAPDASHVRRWLQEKMPVPYADSGVAEGAKSGTRRIVRSNAAVAAEESAQAEAARNSA